MTQDEIIEQGITKDEVIERFEKEEADEGRPCMVARVRDFLTADWLDQESRDWLAGVLVGKGYHTARQALDCEPVVNLLEWAIMYDWPDCYLLTDSYDPRIKRLYVDVMTAAE